MQAQYFYTLVIISLLTSGGTLAGEYGSIQNPPASQVTVMFTQGSPPVQVMENPKLGLCEKITAYGVGSVAVVAGAGSDAALVAGLGYYGSQITLGLVPFIGILSGGVCISCTVIAALGARVISNTYHERPSFDC